MRQNGWTSKVRILGGVVLLLAGVAGPCLRWYDQKANYMAMPSMYEQLSWFALGGMLAVVGAWVAFRLKPWWLYSGMAVLLVGVYIGLIRYDQAADSAQFINFMLRNMGH